MNEPTNADIYQALGGLKAEIKAVKQELVGIHKQTKLTNGRVNALERRNEREDDRKLWEKEHTDEQAPPTPVAAVEAADNGGVKVSDFIKIIVSLIALASALVGAVTLIASKIG